MGIFRWGDFSQMQEATSLNDSGIAIDQGTDMEFASKNFDSDEGEGTLEYLHTSKMSVVIADCKLASARSYEVADDGLVRFYFSNDLSIRSWSGMHEIHAISDNPAGLLVADRDHVMQECMAADKKQSFVTIATRPEWLESRFGIRLSDHLAQENVPETGAVAHYPVNYDYNLRRAIAEMFSRRLPGRLRSAFVAAKAEELLIFGLSSLSENNQEPLYRLTKRDIAAIRSARSIIEQSVTAVPDIQQLSRMVGVNRTKLFYGFKQLYGVSAAHFALQHRMDCARTLLVDTDLKVSEIAAAVGYEHAANFSTQFRMYFDCSPREYRAEVRIAPRPEKYSENQ